MLFSFTQLFVLLSHSILFFLVFIIIILDHPLLAHINEEKGFMHQYGLDDWKFALPIGMLVGMPVIANEVWIYRPCH